MAEGEACLLDSNILLRISKSDDPQHPVSAVLEAKSGNCKCVGRKSMGSRSGTRARILTGARGDAIRLRE